MEVVRVIMLACLVVMVTCDHQSKISDTDVNTHRHFVNGDAHDVDEQELWEEVEAGIYTEKIFHKYSHDHQMTFEGFEHLLANLGLGNIVITDHDIHDHLIEDKFKPLHESHEHTSENGTVLSGDDGHTDGQGHDDDSEGHQHVDIGEGQGHDHGDHDEHSDDDHGNQEDGHHGNSGAEKIKQIVLPSGGKDASRQPVNQPESGEEAGDQESHRDDSEADDYSSSLSKRSNTLPPGYTHNHDTLDNKCVSPKQILTTYRITQNISLTVLNFIHLCPAILYQLDQHACSGNTQHACPQSSDQHFKLFHGEHHDDHHDEDHHGNDTLAVPVRRSFMEIPGKVWGFAVLSVTVISLVGLISVAIVPLMNKALYDHLIQFLVALAVGTLTGDALLHLIPHAMVSHEEGSHDDDSHESHESEGEGHGDHNQAVFKGCVVLGGIYLFFLAERIMGIVSDWRRKKLERKKLLRKTGNVYKLETTAAINEDIGAKLSGHSNRFSSCQDFVLHSNRASLLLAEELCEQLEALHQVEEEGHEEDVTDGGNHGHGHSHGHGDGAPGSVSAIAWMVIMGDGLHNFSDGLAIGAGFASSISVGLSTSIAVFCHELPHELGDFAVLLRAGMSVKMALFYNIVSSVLCFLGMVIGVAVGNISSASVWIFAMTAGIFIYISLVDMLPEITVVDKRFKNRQCFHLLLQVLGISAGVSIMLVIALYESQIKVG